MVLPIRLNLSTAFSTVYANRCRIVIPRARLVYAIKIVFFAAAALVLFSCGARQKNDAFSRYLNQADAAYAAGDYAKTFKSLARAQKKAISVNNCVSIIKRLYKIQYYGAAADFAADFAVKIPGNESLLALCADAHIRADKPTQALEYVRFAADGAAGKINAWLQLELLPSREQSPSALSYAASAINSPILRNDAAVLYAVRQNAAAALQLIPDFSRLYAAGTRNYLTDEEEKSALLWGALLYDAGEIKYSLDLLQSAVSKALQPSPELLSLMSDAAFLLDLRDIAAFGWKRLAAEYPSFSPEIWYNAAALSADADERVALIREALAVFPDYRPCLRMLALAALEAKQTPPDDAITRAIREAGLTTIAMERTSRAVSEDEARAAFVSAADYRKDHLLARDPSIELEQKRFEWALQSPPASDSEIWTLLELYPDSTLVVNYAVWLLFFMGDEKTGAALLRHWVKNNPAEVWTQAYQGIASAINGELAEAASFFRNTSADSSFEWQAVANLAVVNEYDQNWPSAAELYTLASSLTASDTVRSELHYQAGRVFALNGARSQAQLSLHYALDLDPNNYNARALLRTLLED